MQVMNALYKAYSNQIAKDFLANRRYIEYRMGSGKCQAGQFFTQIRIADIQIFPVLYSRKAVSVYARCLLADGTVLKQLLPLTVIA